MRPVNLGWGRRAENIARPAEPAAPGTLANIEGAALLVANAAVPQNCPRPINIYLGEPVAVDPISGETVTGIVGNLRARLTATSEQGQITLVCDWRGLVTLVAQSVEIGWSWTRIPTGADPITFNAMWGLGAGDNSQRPTLFDPITTVGGIVPPLGTETWNVPNLASGLTLASDQPTASGQADFQDAQGVTLSVFQFAQGERVPVPAGSRRVTVTNTGAVTMAENSGLIWDFTV